MSLQTCFAYNNENINVKDIKDLDKTDLFFHYTNKKNLENIFKEGLKPKIGKNSKGVEKTDKIFFSIGEIGILTIMDVWIRWLISKPSIEIFYLCGAYLARQKWFPQIIINFSVNYFKKNSRKIKRAYKKMDKILNDSVFLILNLKENIDFDYCDIDEVKSQNYTKEFLEFYFNNDGDNVNSNNMEFWNMHTYSGKIVDKSKITLLKNKNNIDAKEIINYFASKNEKYVMEKCKDLYEYLTLYND